MPQAGRLDSTFLSNLVACANLIGQTSQTGGFVYDAGVICYSPTDLSQDSQDVDRLKQSSAIAQYSLVASFMFSLAFS
jgi:hypothetical protein